MSDNEIQQFEEVSDDLYEKFVIQVDKGQQLLRIDKFIQSRVEGATRNKVQRAISTGMVLVNGKEIKSNYKIKPDDEIIVYSDTSPDESNVIPENLPLNIMYEDDEIMIINKPVGVVVHPGSGNYTGTLLNAVAWHLQEKNPSLSENELPRFGLVHRIDKNTSGILVLAKTKNAMTHLAKQFFDHTVNRLYIALVWGDVVEDSGTIIGHVGRHLKSRKIFTVYPDGDYGKDATTNYTVLERFGYVTMVQCKLETGRTHQIRVHMKHIGHTLFNDDTYGGDRILKGTVFTKYKQFVDNCFAMCPRQALHAQTLGFIHPKTGKEMHFESPLPDDMSNVVEKWKAYAKTKKIIE